MINALHVPDVCVWALIAHEMMCMMRMYTVELVHVHDARRARRHTVSVQSPYVHACMRACVSADMPSPKGFILKWGFEQVVTLQWR